jgi:ubiquinone/menaquinone biosynthesis C-methylase UbiE
MQELGFDVFGIDDSRGQIEQARVNVRDPDAVAVGSVLNIPAANASYDFAYVINVIHHLPSVADQRRAFAELFRVLRPGGLLFLHEINTRNILFRFYMGYVFPALNCIDEGVERWLLPNQLHLYTDQPVVETRYFTFLPEFVPRVVSRVTRPIERRLEASPLAVYSAHYMAVFRKDSPV